MCVYGVHKCVHMVYTNVCIWCTQMCVYGVHNDTHVHVYQEIFECANIPAYMHAYRMQRGYIEAVGHEIWRCPYMYANIYFCIHVHMCLYTIYHMYLYICTYTFVHMYTYICTYVQMYSHTHITYTHIHNIYSYTLRYSLTHVHMYIYTSYTHIPLNIEAYT